MPPKLYEVKVFRQERQVQGVNPFLVGLDLAPDAAERTAAMLDRHLRGAARRDKADQQHEHLYHLEVRDIDQYGKGAGQVAFRWALPAAAEDEETR
jgi:hypothetical protein